MKSNSMGEGLAVLYDFFRLDLYGGRALTSVSAISPLIKSNSPDQVNNLIYGPELLARDRDGTFTYFLVGDNNNVVGLANEGETVTDRYDYSAFGELLSHTGSDDNRFLFSAEPNDEDSGLVYLRKRYYEMGSGRFISRDRFYTCKKNLYSYCNNNPVSMIDPDGNYTQEAFKNVTLDFINQYINQRYPGKTLKSAKLQCNEYAALINSYAFSLFAMQKGILINKSFIVGGGQYYGPGVWDHYAVILRTYDPAAGKSQYWITDFFPYDKIDAYQHVLLEAKDLVSALTTSPSEKQFYLDKNINVRIYGGMVNKTASSGKVYTVYERGLHESTVNNLNNMQFQPYP